MSRFAHYVSVDHDYVSESRSPLASLIFVAPILLVYELGVIILGPSAMRNGAEQWLRNLLDTLGMGQYVLLPLLTCSVLLGWQHVQRRPWSLSHRTLVRMLHETLLITVGILGIAYLQSWVFQSLQCSLPAPTTCSLSQGSLVRIVGYCGAGIYEELLFRLILIPALAWCLFQVGETRQGGVWGAAVGASLIFSAAHYRVFTQVGDPFNLSTFTFRFMAGMIFAVVFLKRGFGITAGVHTMYDISVALLAD